jgi:hypothetical protein
MPVPSKKKNNRLLSPLWSAATSSIRDMIFVVTTSSGVLCFLLLAKRYL